MYGQVEPYGEAKYPILGSTTSMDTLMCLYGETKPLSLVKAKPAAKTRHVCLYGEAKPVEQHGIDDVAKRVRRTRNIGEALGECSIMMKRSS